MHTTTNKDFDKSTVHHDLLEPLIRAIGDLCDAHDIPLLATFQYATHGDEHSICSVGSLPLTREISPVMDSIASVTQHFMDHGTNVVEHDCIGHGGSNDINSDIRKMN